jgi:hypothetical protein
LNTIEQFNLSVDSLQARELTNYYFKNSRLQMRPAVEEVAYQAALVSPPVWFDSGTFDVGGEKHVLCLNGMVYRLDTGAAVGAGIGGGINNTSLTNTKHSDLDMLIGAREPRPIVSPFTTYTIATGVLPGTISALQITSACSHKGRLYYANTTQIDFGDVSQDRGTMPAANTFDFKQVLDGEYISRIFSLSGQSGAANDSVFVIFGTQGKVLVYAGDSPKSANWNLIGSYNMPAPVGRNAFVELDGDIFVAGVDYCYWFKDVMLGGGQSAYENSPSKDIQNLWKGLTVTGVSHIKELDLIVAFSASNVGSTLQINNWANYGKTTIPVDSYYGWLVYHKTLKCFAFWNMLPSTTCGMREVSPSGGNIKTFYMLGTRSVYALNANKAIDVTTERGTVSIETSWKTPYLSAFEGVGNKVNSVRVWFENTVSGYFEKVRAIFDYSDYNVSLGWYTQSTITQVPPANYGDGQNDGAAESANQYHPVIGASGQGGGVSFQFTQKAKSGSSTTQNQSIYAATAYIEEAGELW